MPKLRHNIKSYAGFLDELRGHKHLTRRHKRWLLDLWRDFEAHAVDPDARIMMAFDEKTEWLTPDETRRFVFLVRGFGYTIGSAGHADSKLPPELMSLVYNIVKGNIPDLRFKLPSDGGVSKEQTSGT